MDLGNGGKLTREPYRKSITHLPNPNTYRGSYREKSFLCGGPNCNYLLNSILGSIGEEEWTLRCWMESHRARFYSTMTMHWAKQMTLRWHLLDFRFQEVSLYICLNSNAYAVMRFISWKTRNAKAYSVCLFGSMAIGINAEEHSNIQYNSQKNKPLTRPMLNPKMPCLIYTCRGRVWPKTNSELETKMAAWRTQVTQDGGRK